SCGVCWLANAPLLCDDAPPTRTGSCARDATGMLAVQVPIGLAAPLGASVLFLKSFPIKMTTNMAASRTQTNLGEGKPSPGPRPGVLPGCILTCTISQMIDTGDGIFVCVPDRDWLPGLCR